VQSHRVIHSIGWDIYSRTADPPFEFARAISSDPAKRLQIATSLFRRFPFGPPGYGWRKVEAGENIVAFDCTKCPVAEFFSGHDSSALCTATWCALDFPVAEKWGGRLLRPKTIAGGHDHCDFRWHTGPRLEEDENGDAAKHAPQE
jgi:ubiquinone biosynthesis protein